MFFIAHAVFQAEATVREISRSLWVSEVSFNYQGLGGVKQIHILESYDHPGLIEQHDHLSAYLYDMCEILKWEISIQWVPQLFEHLEFFQVNKSCKIECSVNRMQQIIQNMIAVLTFRT